MKRRSQITQLVQAINKFSFFIFIVFQAYYLNAQSSTDLGKMVTDEIKEWDRCFENNLFIRKVLHEENLVDKDTLIEIKSAFFSGEKLRLFEYKCLLVPMLYVPTIYPKELNYFVFHFRMKFYRLFGFSKCDINKLFMESPMLENELFAFIQPVFRAKRKKDFISLLKAFKKGKQFFNCQNEILKQANIEFYTTIITPRISLFRI